ncbi:MAG: hypothetical protein R3C49_15145 [Planctomycetaceae bacterium]
MSGWFYRSIRRRVRAGGSRQAQLVEDRTLTADGGTVRSVDGRSCSVAAAADGRRLKTATL